MAWKFNPFVGELDYYEKVSIYVGIIAPSDPEEGQMYINSLDNTMYIYYGGTWQALHVLVPPALTPLLDENGDPLRDENGDIMYG